MSITETKLIYMGEPNPMTDLFMYDMRYEVMCVYTKDEDGWFIDLAYSSNRDTALGADDISFLRGVTGFDKSLPIKEFTRYVKPRTLYVHSQFMPENQRFDLEEMKYAFGYSGFEKHLSPIIQAMIDLDIDKLRTSEDKNLSDEDLLLQAHKKRAILKYAPATKRVESIRWLHKKEYGGLFNAVNGI